MPRGVHHEHLVKSESDLERVWVSVDDEGNELGYTVETLALPIVSSVPPPPLSVKVKIRPHAMGLAYATVAGAAGAGIVEIAVHFGR